jgi:putative aldouronate transport system permease protein
LRILYLLCGLSFSVSPNLRMAGAVIALIPVVLIYPLAQKYFVRGIMLGSTKE